MTTLWKLNKSHTNMSAGAHTDVDANSHKEEKHACFVHRSSMVSQVGNLRNGAVHGNNVDAKEMSRYVDHLLRGKQAPDLWRLSTASKAEIKALERSPQPPPKASFSPA